MGTIFVALLAVTLFLAMPWQTSGKAVISLAQQYYVVTEGLQGIGKMFEVRIQKVGVAASSVNVVVEIVHPTSPVRDDFIGTSQPTVFPAGIGQLERSVFFTVRNDALAEPDETFSIVLKVTNGDGMVGNPNTGTVTIAASDDAFGVFSIEEPLTNVVTEGKDGVPNYAMFTVRRIGGIFGAVNISFEVKGMSDEAIVGADVAPSSGQIQFVNEQTTGQIRLQILDDDIPENDESFHVDLTKAVAVVTVGGPRVVQKNATLIIRRNDAPLRFAQEVYRTDEKSEAYFLTLSIYRGIDTEATTIVGAITDPATVSYFFVSVTATMASDYLGTNGTVGFSQGVTKGTITVQILPDNTPETEEVFEVHLADPSGDAVIIDPRVARVVIESNDEPNGILRIKGVEDGKAEFYINEDDTNQYTGLVVTRGAGRFSEVSVDWTLTRLDSDEDVLTDLNPNSGTLVFEDGVEDMPVVINVVRDRAQEPAERFRFDLVAGTVTGGARVNGVTSAIVILEDSDDLYGVVDLGGENLQTFESMALPRALEIALIRTGGSQGAIEVQYMAEYVMNGEATTGQFTQAMPSTIILQDNQKSLVFTLTIRDNAFLEFGATFRITLLDVTLVNKLDFGPFNSPRIGLSGVLHISISEEAANGMIGFEDITTRKVVEPDGSVIPSLQVALVVKREGTNGVASVEWMLEGVGPNADKVTLEDTGPTSGRVTMESGQARASIVVLILHDDIPETDEMIQVRLMRVSPEGTQRIDDGADRVDLLIQENDMPGGVFEFGLSMASSYTVEEEGAAIDITVVRYGGSLTERYIQHIIEPAGEVEFYGATYVMKFEPGESVKNSTVIAKSDGVAELAEYFQLKLVKFGDSQAAIGKKSIINITVAENDEPYGVFHFKAESLDKQLDERNILLDSRDWVNLTVVRSRGLFNSVSVKWHVVDIDVVEDIGPLNGILNFSPGQRESIIRIQSIADDIPERPETFYINLTDPTGGAIIGEPRVARVTVTENDYPIFFKDPAVVRVQEPGQATLTVAREGSLNVEVKVRFRTVDGTASAVDHDYVPLDETVITFSPGQSEHQFVVTTLDDSLPETDEDFFVILYDPTGDVSVFGGDRATVIIEANDNANGIFHFIPPFEKTTREGVPIEFDVKRDEGIFSEVQVHWEVLYKESRLLAVDDFENVRGNFSFQDQQQVSSLTIIPSTDTIPEYSEFFIIRLTDVTGGGPSGQVGTLAATELEVELEVLQNDDPSGVFVFPPDSREVSLPEDVNPGDELLTRVQLMVSRNQGKVGEVAVAWEIFSYQIASAGKLPSMRDLLFLGNFAPEVTEAPEQRRPETGSLVLSFSGCAVCWGEVPAESQLPSDTVENGFSISSWVKPAANTDGYILAKTSPDGSRHYYALKLTTSSTSMTLELRYSVPTSPNNQVVARALNLNLQDGGWHHLLVTIDSALAEFFIDGQSQSASRLMEESTLDGPGPLIVGAITPGAEQYTGLMQDLRLFARKLDLGEIKELYETPSQKDVRPISGSLRYREGEGLRELTVFSKDDNEEEANELFAVRLISARGGARVSDTEAIAVLTVLKSDNANGLFGISGVCVALSPGEEDSVWSCPVRRNRGDADVVTLHWRLVGPVAIATDREASEDFINATGTLEFEAGQRDNAIIFEGLEDDLPELSQTYRLELTEAVSRDGLVGTTPTSGASIDPDAATTEIVVPDNDYPYGLLEFSTGAPPGNDDPRIPPSTDMDVVRVAEEAGSVRLLVVRAQGLVGEVTVEWRTIDGTAVSSGKTSPDYVARVDRLTFLPGQRYAYIDVTIRDNSVPENVKSFDVELVNPGGGAAVHPDRGSRIRVEIQHSDQAYGVFQFDDASLRVLTSEHSPDGIGDNDVNLRVMRAGGTIMAVNVTWAVLFDDDNDLEETSGHLTFQQGQTEALLNLKIRDDTKPELEETFTVQLMNASLGTIGSQAVARVVVAANDDPYGVYVISQTDRPVRTEEANTVVPIAVLRKELSGLFGFVNVSWRTLVPGEVYPYLPGGILRAQHDDFLATSGWVVFEPSQSELTFNVTITDDDQPEIDESVFVILEDAQLVRAEQAAQVPNSPRLGNAIETYGHIIINENDSPAGVLQLSAVEVILEEDQPGPVVFVNRSAGAFGQVSVKFEVIALSATYGLDYSITSTDVVLASGERLKRVPIEIINDQTPELEEAFTVRLLDLITGGATLGPIRETRVIIAASDDPFGAFAFEMTQSSVEEPEDGTGRVVSLPVIRRGGTVGVVSVHWEATLGGEEPVDDISPTSGTIYFISSQTHQNVTLNILPDSVPEGIESIVLTLVDADNGGRIDTLQHQSFISIQANDNPHGVVEFAEDIITVIEPDVDGPQYVEVSRVGGSYGQVRVYYDVFDRDLLTLALEEAESIFSYYLPPVSGKVVLPAASTRYPVQGLTNPLLACATFCLMSEACLSFDFNATGPECNWFTIADDSFVLARAGFFYYETDTAKKSALFALRASPGVDYEPVTEASVIINDGATIGVLPVTIRADAFPELPEIFQINITRVELVGGPPRNPRNLPRLGNRSSAIVSIAKNDNANGVFRIYSNDPRAMAGGQTIMLEERDKVFVKLLVEREGGSIGEVFVTWSVNLEKSSATRGLDFIADGATLRFAPGDTQRTLTIGIEDDDIPENDETVVIELHEAEGGATIGPENTATVIIQANDNVAGRLYFSETSYLVKEGELLTITVERSDPAIGEVTVDWSLTTTNSKPPHLRFDVSEGTLKFLPDENIKLVNIQVLQDDEPRVNQEYTLQLSNVRTDGVRDTGSAGVDPQRSVAIVTIEGGNEPHGIFSFATSSQSLRVSEGDKTAMLTLDRKFGVIGTVRVYYEVKVGSLTPLSTNLLAAIPMSDFVPVVADYVVVDPGEASSTIPVQLYDDDIPEVDEVLLVNITGVILEEPINSGFTPKLAQTGTIAEVIIEANDGTFGEVIFSFQSQRLFIEEETLNLTLAILREQGTFGEVSVFCFAQSLVGGAIRGQDFNFEPREITFLAGETVKYVIVSVFDDDLPEPNEQLEILLASPKGGLTIGNPDRAVITILASDRASGIVSFDSNEIINVNEPTSLSSAHSKAELRLSRAPGVFGDVNVPYEIKAADGSTNVTDLTPTSGYIRFNDREGEVTLEITVVGDDEPEEAETFILTLLPPDEASLGLITQRTIVIERNDAPYGLVQIHPAGTRNRSMTIDEGTRVLFLDVMRSQGSLDEVSVDLVTRSITAHSQIGSDVYLATLQQINVRDMSRWGSFEKNGETYLVLLYQHKRAPLLTPVGSSGEGRPVNLGNVTQSVLFRWQGAPVLVQSIETDGASSATTFNIEGNTYLFITNKGGKTRHQTMSRLYRVMDEGDLQVIQDLKTKGATDSIFFSRGSNHYLVVTNERDNAGRTNINSDVYEWDFFTQKFSTSPVQYLPTRGAAAAEITVVDDVVFLVIANGEDATANTVELNSLVYRLDANNRFTIHQQIPTKGAADVTSFNIGSDSYIVLANSRDDDNRYHQMAVIYVWNRVTQLFTQVQELAVASVGSVQSFNTPDGRVHLSLAMEKTPSAIYTWDDNTGLFNQSWFGRPLKDLYPVTINQRAGPMVILAEARPVNESSGSTVNIYQLALVDLGESDYVHRALTLTFKPGQTFLRTSAVSLEDNVPEDTEGFALELTEPRGGAELGAAKEVVVNILSNDNGHGILEFAEDSLERYEEEIPSRDSIVQLNVIRRMGTYGRVVVRWQAVGDHNDIHDLSPTSGQIEFSDGQAVASITLTIKDDQVSELDEVTRVTLAGIVESGTPLPGRGAQIGEKKTARVTVIANDSPYGVVSWEKSAYITTEPEGTDTTTMIHIIRSQGSLGTIRVGYITSRDQNLPSKQKAVSGEDYVAIQSSVDMADGVTRVPVEITILADNDPEVAETFVVNITGVQLVGGALIVGAGASVRRPGNVASITIAENDNARGIISFDVNRNIEGRVDTFEGAGTLQLRLVRTVGFFGEIQVAWQTSPREATNEDFSPAGGTVVFVEGQTDALLEIEITDDDISEELQTFDVQLIRVTSGGATLGSDNSVRVGIIRNDSPNGIFSFVKTRKTVRESEAPSDPEGAVTFDVQREGTDGVVNLQWRLSADAVDDFEPPLTGTLVFGPGEAYKRLTLRTRVDDLLEGEEEFTLSLVSADNNGDISPTQGDATVVILPDTGAGGIISIAPQSRFLLLGEPSVTYDGKAELVVERKVGTFGEIRVSWQITRRNLDTFVQHQDTIVLADKQERALIVVQIKDDNTPELRRLFTLEITAATGGATVDPLARTAEIVVVASDYPHGLFEFSPPQEIVISEDAIQVTIPVMRNQGSAGLVRVEYETSPGTADSDETLAPDFRSSKGWLVFGNNQARQTISIEIVNDVRSEGPEYFFVNLTQVQLQEPANNNYTVVNGLQLDMAPEIGELNYKTVTIDKNDNAEGVVEFAAEARAFTVSEEDGIAKIPVVRGPGTFGEVRVKYTSINKTAKAGDDYLLPDGEVILTSGMSANTINVTIVDDVIREFAEVFEIRLDDVTGGALLGARTTAIVTIAKSDYPNGKFSFVGQSIVSIPNPAAARSLVLYVERTGGLIGRQTVYWRIMGPSNPNRVLEEINDISSPGPTGGQVTTGILQWEANEDGAKSFVISIKPHSGWEIEKIFNIILYDIQGFPANSGSGEASVTGKNFTVIVQKYGHPNGIVRFDGVAQQQRILQEPPVGKRQVRFPIYRREGTIGTIKVNWQVQNRALGSDNNVTADVDPASGTATIEADKRSSEIRLSIVFDGLPELNEDFTMHLVSAEGGAEIDSTFNTSSFTVQYNGHPHGRFSLDPEAQTVVVSSNLQRSVRLNITRHDGTVGRVRVSYTIVYDQAQTGISYIPSAGAVTFEDGSRFGIELVDIENSVNISPGSSFTATLTDAVFIGVGVTMPPQLIAGKTTTKVFVPPEAANSEVGFQNEIISVEEGTNLVDVVLERRGTYGSLQVAWLTGFPENEGPDGFSRGKLSEESGRVSMLNGENRTAFKIQLTPRPSVPELFALHLPNRPVSQTLGGAELWPGRTLSRIEPHGVVRFDPGSRTVQAQEPEDREREVTLDIERLYGSLGNIQIRYSTYSGTAIGDVDYKEIKNGAVNMNSRQTRSTIYIQIMSDVLPEEDEFFFVNFTSITRLPTGTEQEISPRLSSMYSSAKVTILKNNDPYGVISVVAKSGESDGKVTEPGSVQITVIRTGGTFGRISVLVRTIGGGEPWDTHVGQNPGRTNETISEVLGNRDIRTKAVRGQDYQVLEQTVTFEEGQTDARLVVRILDDTSAEDDEVFFVYIVPQTEGVRVAQPARDNGRKGFASITIRKNDFWNGWIGFSRTNSTAVTGDEDSGLPVRLTIERLNASYDALSVTWRARLTKFNEELKSDSLDLTKHLARFTDVVDCPAGPRFCVFDVPLKDDKDPENQTSFIVELTDVGDGAQIDPSRKFANVTLLPSDNPSGLVEFAPLSRLVYKEKSATSVRLTVERIGYLQKRVTVRVSTMELVGPSPNFIAKVPIYNALDGADFNSFQEQLVFEPGERIKTISIVLDLSKASDNPYPKMFRVALSDVTNGAVLGVDRANVTITDLTDLPHWNVWRVAQKDLTNGTIDSLMRDLERVVQEPLRPNQLSIAEENLERVIGVAETQGLLQGSRISIMSVFCRLLDPVRTDAARGKWQLSHLLERFAYSYLSEFDCDQCCTSSTLIYSPDCPHVRFAVAKWYPEDINGYQYQGRLQDTFQIPDNLLRVQDNGRNSPNPKCEAVSFVEYSSSVWFLRNSDVVLLNNRVFSAGVRGQVPRVLSQPATFKIHTEDRSIAAKRAQCVFFDESIQQWTDRECSVINNLQLAIDDFVHCSCKHMSSYSVISRVKDPNHIGYPVWFHISCYVAMVGLVLTILSHHICIRQTMFSANLIMHMCFATFAAELCYVIDAYLSPGHLLDIAPDANNYRCIVMSIFLHYFFLAQFMWMMTQSINFWKILVLNDEHTERKYVLYFLLGWGLPGLVVFLFCLLTYIIYHYGTTLDADRFYGDVNSNGEICFVVNPYAALCGVIIPALICLMVVGIVFIQAFQVTPQWQAYDDIYRERFNMHEIRVLLLFWAIIILTWLWGGLHMAYGQLWMLVLFCIFNVAIGIYAFVVYAALRNPCAPCFKPQKASYAINYNGTSDMGEPVYPPVSIPSVPNSIKGSRASLINDAWEKESVANGSHLKVKRSPVNGNVYVVPAPPYDTKTVTSQRVDDHDSQDFDDLIFALKTGGGYTPSESSHPPNNINEVTETDANFEMRRISIADTHL